MQEVIAEDIYATNKLDQWFSTGGPLLVDRQTFLIVFSIIIAYNFKSIKCLR